MYDFRDLNRNVGVPTEESWNDDRYYQDPTHIGALEGEIRAGAKDDLSVKLARWIRQKVHGKDVREALARFVLWVSVLYHRTLGQANQIGDKQRDADEKLGKLDQRLTRQIKNVSGYGEVIDARYSKHYNRDFNTVKDRLDVIEDSYWTVSHGGHVNEMMTLEDDHFSSNHEYIVEGEVPNYSRYYPSLVIATIGDTEQDTFYFKKVGEIDVRR